MRNAAGHLQDALGLMVPPVAIAFRSTPPEGVPRVPKALAAGCAYWMHAAQGNSFYTTAEDHYGCPIGAFTHGAALPDERAHEFDEVIKTMLSLDYMQREELPAIPHRVDALECAVYAPLHKASFEPDLVLVRGNVRQVMLLSEAARAAGVFAESATMGRPACAMLPQAQKLGRGVTSLGCIGNRVYTGLEDDELYFTLPGAKLDAVMEKLDRIVSANEALQQYHLQRRAANQRNGAET
jgi:uncharacterized protein (DUF169 family)